MYSVSVVICAYTEDRWNDLVASISSIKKQTLLPLEIILVVDHNAKLLARAKGQFPEVFVVENEGVQGLSDARNSGIAVSRGDVVVFMDEDAVAEPTWLSGLMAHYNDPAVAGVGGLVLPNWIVGKPDWFPIEFNWVVGCSYRGLPEITSAVRNMIGCNMSLRREVFERVDGFRSGIGRIGTIPLGCEETELCIRIGQQFPNSKFVFEPSARVLHSVPKQRGQFRYFLSRCYAEGISKALITKLVGKDGVRSERTYTMKTLPTGIWRGFVDVFLNRDLAGLKRAIAIIIGFTVTVFGYIFGKLSFFQPLKSNSVVAQGFNIDDNFAAE